MSRRPAMVSNHDNQYGAGYDELIAKRPARIVWRRNRRGVLIAVSVQDPNCEAGSLTRGQAREQQRLVAERRAEFAADPDFWTAVMNADLAEAVRREV